MIFHFEVVVQYQNLSKKNLPTYRIYVGSGEVVILAL